MLHFLLRRAMMLVATLFVSSFIIFASLYVAPGNPVTALSGGRSLPPGAIKVLEQRYHLNDPFFVRYWDWLRGVLHGDLGYSIALHQNVSTIIGSAIGVTTELVVYAGLITVLVGVGLGVLGGLRRGAADRGVIVVTTVSAAIPAFVAAIVLILVFAVNLGWFPVMGPGTGFLDRIWHLTLPAIALAVASMAIVARITRASVREEERKEHVQTAISRGIPYHLVVRRHVLRNASIPIVTVAALTVASLIAVAAVVERAFNLRGVGSYLIEAANNKDFAVVQGTSLILVFAFVIANTLVDLLYAFLDPRVKLGSKAM
jgi:peptide/nickel transport system permease protein